MKPIRIIPAIALSIVLITGTAHAQFFGDPSGLSGQGTFRTELSLSLNETDYELKAFGERFDYSVERQIVGLSASYGLADAVDVFIGAGYIVDAELNLVVRDDFDDDEFENGGGFKWDDSDDGYMFLVGARGLLHAANQFSLMGYGYLQFIDEKYGRQDDGFSRVRAKGRYTELVVGLLGRYDIMEGLHVFAGVEIVVVEDSEVVVRETFHDDEFDFINGFQSRVTIDAERDDIFTIRAGVAYEIEQFFVRGGVAFIGEETFTLAGGMRF